MARTKGAVGFTDAERTIIEISLEAGKTTPEIARFLGRERSAVWRQVQRIKADEGRNPLLPFGPRNE